MAGVAVKDDHYLIVAALDIGTTYSGYAFARRDQFNKDPLQINTNIWKSGTQLLSLKTPTCLLLDSNMKMEAFGYEAENRYSDLVEKNEHDEYYYFHRFKMSLYKAKVLESKFTYRLNHNDFLCIKNSKENVSGSLPCSVY